MLYFGIIVLILNCVFDPDSSIINALIIMFVNILYLVDLVLIINSYYNINLPEDIKKSKDYLMIKMIEENNYFPEDFSKYILNCYILMYPFMNKNIDFSMIILYGGYVLALTYLVPYYTCRLENDKKFVIYRYVYDVAIYLVVISSAEIIYRYNKSCSYNYFYFLFFVGLWTYINLPNIYK